MKFIPSFFRTERKNRRKTLDEYKREMLVLQGREQFKKMIDRGLGMPVGML